MLQPITKDGKEDFNTPYTLFRALIKRADHLLQEFSDVGAQVIQQRVTIL